MCSFCPKLLSCEALLQTRCGLKKTLFKRTTTKSIARRIAAFDRGRGEKVSPPSHLSLPVSTTAFFFSHQGGAFFLFARSQKATSERGTENFLSRKSGRVFRSETRRPEQRVFRSPSEGAERTRAGKARASSASIALEERERRVFFVPFFLGICYGGKHSCRRRRKEQEAARIWKHDQQQVSG